MIRWLTVAGVCCAALACATGSREAQWVRVNPEQPVDSEQLARDRAECLASFGTANPTGPRPASVDRRRLTDCMRTHGWLPASER